MARELHHWLISKNFLDLPILMSLHCSDGEDEGEVTIVEQGLKSRVGRQTKTVILGQPGAMQTATLSGELRYEKRSLMA